MSSAARQSSARSSVPSARMSHSMPASSRMPSPSRVERADRARRARARALVEAVGHRQRLAVVGDRDVLEAGARAPPPPSSRDVVAAVGLGGVHVQVAAQVAALDRGAAACRAAAASISPRFSRSSGGTQARPSACVDVLLGLAGDARVVVDPEQAVLVQLEAARDRAVAQRDVVRLRAGEVLQRGAAALGGDEPQVGLEAAAQQHARLGVAVAEHALDQRVARRSRPSATRRRRSPGCRGRRRSRSRGAGCRPASMSAPGARSRR